MLINLPRTLENDIMKFCQVNEISDVNSFIVSCLRNGYNIVKFGLTPKDNIDSQNKPLEIKEINNGSTEEKPIAEDSKGIEQEKSTSNNRRRVKTEEVIERVEKNENAKVGRKKIRIVKND